VVGWFLGLAGGFNGWLVGWSLVWVARWLDSVVPLAAVVGRLVGRRLGLLVGLVIGCVCSRPLSTRWRLLPGVVDWMGCLLFAGEVGWLADLLVGWWVD